MVTRSLHAIFCIVKYSIHNLPHLKHLRKELRNEGTSAEAVLWTYLKNKQLSGRKFRRQHSIKNFIVDFYCPKEALIIELDGQEHYTVSGQASDELRDQHLTLMGFRILRFENKAVLECIDAVLDEIKSCFTTPD